MYAAFLASYAAAYLTPALFDSRFHSNWINAVYGVGRGALSSMAVFAFFHCQLTKIGDNSGNVLFGGFRSHRLTPLKVMIVGLCTGMVAGIMPALTGYTADLLATGRTIDSHVGRFILGPYVAFLTLAAVVSYDEFPSVREHVAQGKLPKSSYGIFGSMWWIAVAVPIWLIVYGLFPQVARRNGRGTRLDWDAPYSWLVWLAFLLVAIGIAGLVWFISRKDSD